MVECKVLSHLFTKCTGFLFQCEILMTFPEDGENRYACDNQAGNCMTIIITGH